MDLGVGTSQSSLDDAKFSAITVWRNDSVILVLLFSESLFFIQTSVNL